MAGNYLSLGPSVGDVEITLPNSQGNQSFRSVAGKRSNGRAVYLGDPRLPCRAAHLSAPKSRRSRRLAQSPQVLCFLGKCSSNTTRRYLGAVIKVLSDMPSELIEEGFRTLAEDRSFSPKMRDKFRAVLEKRLFGDHGW